MDSRDGPLAAQQPAEIGGKGPNDHADEALNLYLQVAEAKSQYREDARATAGAMLLARGRRADALKQYEALANEAEKPATRAEAAVRAFFNPLCRPLHLPAEKYAIWKDIVVDFSPKDLL